MNKNLDITDQLENEQSETLPLIQFTKKKASKNDSPLEKEMRRFNKLVKELEEQEKENERQKVEDEKYQQLFFAKVQPLLIDLAHTQLLFIERLEEIFYANKFSKNLERSFVAFAIPILQDASSYLDAAAEKMNNYINWQLTLFSKTEQAPVVQEEDEETYLNEEDGYSTEQPFSRPHDETKNRLADDMEKKSISELYKELAKLIHPDLEQDEAIKYRKEQLMKELTAAKDKDDVHAMLFIKQKADVINKTSSSEKSYSLQLLKLYNNSMKKKLEALKRILQQKIFHSFGSKESFYSHGKKPLPVETRIKYDINNIKELEQNLQANTRIISTAAHLKELLQQ
ncbi:MAG TPA: hypothetical protein VLR49_16190 [Ferruginibacter sp.]|nr:hypothetical protein [Ferruginibacter sp.]